MTRGRPRKYNFENMEIGDSFFVKKKDAPLDKNSIALAARQRVRYQTLPEDFKVKVLASDGGYEVIRIA